MSSLIARTVWICICLIFIEISQSDHACTPYDGIIAEINENVNVYNGFTFMTRKEWNANNWRNDICSCTINDTTEMKPFSKPYIITIHHTAIPSQSNSTNDSISKVQWIQNLHQNTRLWCDIAYHFIVDSAGNIFQGRPFWDENETYSKPINKSYYKWPLPRLVQGSHSENANTNNIGISVIGCYDSNITNCPNGTNIIKRFDRTYTRLVQLISWICDYYNIDPSNNTIVRHSHWKTTECPGNILGAKQLFNDIIEDVQITVNDGNGLCFDYSNNRDGHGRCVQSNECSNKMIDTNDEIQCKDNDNQICCKIASNDKGKNPNKDLGPFYIIIVIVVFIVFVIVIAYGIRKRREYQLKNGAFSDLTQEIQSDP